MAGSGTGWSFTVWTGLAFAAMIAGLLTLENGQSFPMWMLAAYAVLLAGGAVEFVAANGVARALEPDAAASVGLAVVGLGAGAVIAAQPTSPVTVTEKVATIEWTYSRGSGNHYELTAADGTFYELVPSDFSPELPGGLDSPALRGQAAVLTLDRGTAQVLAMTFDGQSYQTDALAIRSARQVHGWVIGGLLAVVGAAALALAAIGRWPSLLARS